MDTTTRTPKALRKARMSFARHVAAKAEERTAKGSARFERKGRGLRARLREALTLAELMDLAGGGL